MTDNSKPRAATEPADLEKAVMDPSVPKTEREWWAKREIERLSELLAKNVRPFFECPDCGKDIADQDKPHDPGCLR